MPTRGCFVCHVHYLIHDGVIRSSPCGPHHENFRRNLYHMFVSGLFCKPNLYFVLSYGIRVASMSSVDSIPFLSGILVSLCEYQSFLFIEIVIPILFPTGAPLFEMIPSFYPSARSILSFLNGVCSVFLKLPLFSRPPTPFFFKDPDFLIKYPFIHVKSLHSFQSMC